MQTKLYRELASRVQARSACQKTGNNEWFAKHTEFAEKLLGELPHGSGLDGTWGIDYAKSHAERLVLTMQYHAMDENGFYDGWIDFTLTVKPSLALGIALSIVGNFGKYQDIKEYLYDILDHALQSTIDTEKVIPL